MGLFLRNPNIVTNVSQGRRHKPASGWIRSDQKEPRLPPDMNRGHLYTFDMGSGPRYKKAIMLFRHS